MDTPGPSDRLGRWFEAKVRDDIDAAGSAFVDWGSDHDPAARTPIEAPHDRNVSWGAALPCYVTRPALSRRHRVPGRRDPTVDNLYGRVMHHLRKWVVEVVQEPSPLLVPRRGPEAFDVVRQGVPFDQEQIPMIVFHTARERQRAESRRSGDDVLGRGKGFLEARLLTRHYLKDRVLYNHPDIMARPLSAVPNVRRADPLPAFGGSSA